MTMHLARGLTTVRTSKPKQKKLTKAEYENLVLEHKQYNKRMRQNHMHDLQLSFEDYQDYVRGVLKPRSRLVANNESWKPTEGYRRETVRYESLDTGGGVATKKEPQKYTGTLIKGIATMHKSNAVPVINDEQARDISAMRR